MELSGSYGFAFEGKKVLIGSSEKVSGGNSNGKFTVKENYFGCGG